jgi:ribonuclease E
LSIVRLAEEHAMKDNTGQVLVQAPVEIANYLLNEKRRALAEIEQRHDAPIVIVADEQLHTPHYEVTRLRENELTEETAKPSYQRGTPRRLATIALTKANLNVPAAPVVKNVKPTQPAPLREPRPAPPAPVPAPAPVAAVPQVAPTSGGLIGWLKGLFGSEPTPAPAPARADAQTRGDRNDRGNQQQRRDQRGGKPQGRDRDRDRGDRNRRDESRGGGEARQQNAQPAGQQPSQGQQGQGKGQQQKQPQQNKPQQQPRPQQQKQPQAPQQQNAQKQNAQKQNDELRKDAPVAAPTQTHAENVEKPVSAHVAEPAVIAATAVATEQALATPSTAAVTTEAAQPTSNAETQQEKLENGEAGGRRRRGRRGGRRRRRGGEAAAGTGAAADDIADDVGAGEELEIGMDRSQPEFDFDDESDAPVPRASVEATPAPVKQTIDADVAQAPRWEAAPVAAPSKPTAPVIAVSEPIEAGHTPASVAPVEDAAPVRAPIASTPSWTSAHEEPVEIAPATSSVASTEATTAPAAEAPVPEAPVAETSAAEAPIAEAPSVEAPTVEAPIVEASVAEAPAVQRVVNETTTTFNSASSPAPAHEDQPATDRAATEPRMAGLFDVSPLPDPVVEPTTLETPAEAVRNVAHEDGANDDDQPPTSRSA